MTSCLAIKMLKCQKCTNVKRPKCPKGDDDELFGDQNAKNPKTSKGPKGQYDNDE